MLSTSVLPLRPAPATYSTFTGGSGDTAGVLRHRERQRRELGHRAALHGPPVDLLGGARGPAPAVGPPLPRRPAGGAGAFPLWVIQPLPQPGRPAASLTGPEQPVARPVGPC